MVCSTCSAYVVSAVKTFKVSNCRDEQHEISRPSAEFFPPVLPFKVLSLAERHTPDNGLG